MADILNDTFNKNKRQCRVIFQQKKPLLNYELNLIGEITNNKIQDLINTSISNSYAGDSFKVIPSTSANEVFVKKGVFYHNGYPIELTQDVSVSCPVPPLATDRIDTLYLEWYISEVDGVIDPTIGFVTTKEEQLNFELNVVENADPTAVDETIQFVSSTKTITLNVGYFPNWLRLAGVKFKTNALINTGSSYFTVASSPDEKTIIVSETLTDETLANVTFTEYDPSGAVPKYFQAYRKNFFILAKITRHPAITVITESDISDTRDAVTYNFVKKGCEVSVNTGLSVQISEGEAIVGDTEYFLESTTPVVSVTASSINYVYIEDTGYVVSNTTEPTGYHVLLAEVRTDLTSITSIEDKRTFIPFAWSYKYGGEGEGETGFPAAVQRLKAGEDISIYDVVYVYSTDTCKKASASLRTTMPAIGIAPQSFLTNQIDNIVVFGEISNPAWSWTPNDVLYVDISTGSLVNSATAFSTGSYVQRFGKAITATKIFVNPDPVFIKKIVEAEIPLVVLKPSGELEVVSDSDKISADRLSFLAPIEISSTTTFEIKSGRYFINDNDNYYFSGQTIDLSLGTYQTSAITSGYYNKAFFTINSSNTISMYEGTTPSIVIPSEDPIIPANEIPICVVTFKDNGLGLPGSINNIAQSDIIDKRNWLNLGSVLDTSAFKPVFKTKTSLTIQKGGAWFNHRYFTLTSNLTYNLSSFLSSFIVAPTDPCWVYLDISTTGSNLLYTAGIPNFLISTDQPTQRDLRIYIPLGYFGVVWDPVTLGFIVDKTSFLGTKTKYWKYRDTPYIAEQEFSVLSNTSVFTITNFSFLSTDYLDVEINGIKYTEYTKNATLGTVTFSFTVKTGANVIIRKV